MEEVPATEGLLPAVERSSGEVHATVDGSSGPDSRTLDAERTSGEMTVAGNVRLGGVSQTTVVETTVGRGARDFE